MIWFVGPPCAANSVLLPTADAPVSAKCVRRATSVRACWFSFRLLRFAGFAFGIWRSWKATMSSHTSSATDFCIHPIAQHLLIGMSSRCCCHHCRTRSQAVKFHVVQGMPERRNTPAYFTISVFDALRPPRLNAKFTREIVLAKLLQRALSLHFYNWS